MKQRKRDRGVIQLGKDLQPEKRLSFEELNAGAGPQPVVCLRCADGPPAVPSVRDVCVRCLAAVWVSRATEADMSLMRQPEILCAPCMVRELEAAKGDTDGHP